MDAARPERQKTSPWLYVGCGCAAFVVLVLTAFAGFTFFAYRKGKELEAALKDPKARAAKAREVLAWSELPAGYHPLGGFSIPWVIDMAMLSDQEPPAGGEQKEAFRDRGLIYIRMRFLNWNREEKQRFIEGKGDQPGWFQRSNVQIETGDRIGHGTVDAGGQEVLYSAQRGEIAVGNERRDGIVTILLPGCPGDDRVRFGIWFGPDPAPDQPVASVDFAGTPADPEAIRDFASHFRFCPQ